MGMNINYVNKIDDRENRKHVDTNGRDFYLSSLLLTASDSLDL
jgi:hypothetical protein